MHFALFCVAIFFTGCNSENRAPELYSGHYYAIGEYKSGLTPYVLIDTDNKDFSICEGHLVSYAEIGTYEIRDGKLTATTQTTTFTFEIKDAKTLVLVQIGEDLFTLLPIGTQFVYRKDFI